MFSKRMSQAFKDEDIVLMVNNKLKSNPKKKVKY